MNLHFKSPATPDVLTLDVARMKGFIRTVSCPLSSLEGEASWCGNSWQLQGLENSIVWRAPCGKTNTSTFFTVQCYHPLGNFLAMITTSFFSRIMPLATRPRNAWPGWETITSMSWIGQFRVQIWTQSKISGMSLAKKIENKKPTNLDDLWEMVSHHWGQISASTCQNLAHSMPTRIDVVIKARGGHTMY